MTQNYDVANRQMGKVTAGQGGLTYYHVKLLFGPILIDKEKVSQTVAIIA